MKINPTWQTDDGRVKLWLGDCLDVLPTLAAGSVDAVVTDPPYGVSYSSGWDNEFKDVRIAGDETTAARDAALSMMRHVPAIVFGSWKAPKPNGVKMVLIWDKGTVGMGDLSLPWFPSTEEIYVIGRGFVGSRTSSVMRHWVRNKHHPTEKPEALMVELAEKCPGEAILDPFMGSGTTGVAAVRLGRQFLGCETDPTHYETAKRRIIAELERMPLFEDKPVYRQEALLT